MEAALVALSAEQHRQGQQTEEAGTWFRDELRALAVEINQGNVGVVVDLHIGHFHVVEVIGVTIDPESEPLETTGVDRRASNELERGSFASEPKLAPTGGGLAGNNLVPDPGFDLRFARAGI